MIASFADPGQKTTPAPFGHALVKAAQADDRIVGLTADLGKYTDMHIFAKRFPDRFFQMGMAEQLLFGAAAGMAETGLVPFASTYSVFAARRAYDFICLDIAEPNLNVNIVGGLPGLTTGYGPSHQATEDIAIFRGMPEPDHRRPLRLGGHRAGRAAARRARRPDLSAAAARKRAHRARRVRLHASSSARPRCCAAGADVVLISSGLMTMRALQAAERTGRAQCRRRRGAHPDHQALRRRNRTGRGGHGPVGGDCENHTVVGGLFETVASAAVRAGARHADHAGRAAGRVPGRRRAADPARPLRAVDRASRRDRARASGSGW